LAATPLLRLSSKDFLPPLLSFLFFVSFVGEKGGTISSPLFFLFFFLLFSVFSLVNGEELKEEEEKLTTSLTAPLSSLLLFMFLFVFYFYLSFSLSLFQP